MEPQRFNQPVFSFSWYHWEEIQVLLVLVGLISFFARSVWVLATLAFFVIGVIGMLYLMRILEGFFTRKKFFPKLVQRYQAMKASLHGHSLERSRIAMALLASWTLGVLCLHRINLAKMNPADNTPTDVYWILFLGWYCVVCTVIAFYLMWLWNTWSQNESKHVPFFDGLIASLFFYHGLSKKNRIVTFIAAFLLGGIPSYFAIRLSPETPYGYEIAYGLMIPLIGLVLGGAYYAMIHLRNSQSESPEKSA